MNRTTLTAALSLVLAAPLAFAQAPQTPAPDAQAAQPTAPAHTPNPHRQAMRLAKQLNLTADQTAKLEPILADRDQKIAALRADSSLTPQAEHQQMRAIRKSTQEQLSTVLTPDQLQQLRTLQRSHSRKGQQQQPAPAPAA